MSRQAASGYTFIRMINGQPAVIVVDPGARGTPRCQYKEEYDEHDAGSGQGYPHDQDLLYPEFSGEEKNVLHSFSCRMNVRLLPEAQQEPEKDAGSTLPGETRGVIPVDHKEGPLDVCRV